MKRSLIIILTILFTFNLYSQSYKTALNENFESAGSSGLEKPEGWSSFETSTSTDAKWSIVKQGIVTGTPLVFLNIYTGTNYFLYCAGKGYNTYNGIVPYYPNNMEAQFAKQLYWEDYPGLRGTRKVKLEFYYWIPDIGSNDEFYVTIEYDNTEKKVFTTNQPIENKEWEIFSEEIELEATEDLSTLWLSFHFESK